MMKTKLKNSAQAGATMIEVLIAIIIFAVGLLGVATTQTLGLTTTQSSLYRSYAAQLSYELIDLMRSNPAEVDEVASVFLSYDSTDDDSLLAESACSSVAINCTTNQMAQSSLSYWSNRLESLLPNGEAQLTSASGVYTLNIRWEDFRGDQLAQDANAEDESVLNEDIKLISARTTSFRL